MDSNFKVSIYQEPCMGGLSITLWSRTNGKTYMMAPMEMVIKEVSEGNYIEKPTLQIAGELAPIFLKAWAEALDTYGVKTDSDAKIAGTLEATRAHLSDLQKLVFKEKR